MVTSARVIFGVFKSWFIQETTPPITPLPPGTVTLVIGKAKHVMQTQMAAVFKSNPPAVGVLLFESQPAAASGHTLLSTPIK